MKRSICILILATLAASCSSGQSGRKLDEAKAGEVLKQYLAKDATSKVMVKEMGPFYPAGDTVSVNFAGEHIGALSGQRKGQATFQVSQENKWYLSKVYVEGSGGIDTPDREVK